MACGSGSLLRRDDNVRAWPDTPSPSRDTNAPGLCTNQRPPNYRGRRECRMRAASAVSRAKGTKNCTRAYRAAEAIRHSPRNGFTAYSALSLVTGLVCHHRRRDAKHRRQLDASVGASGPHGFAVRLAQLVFEHQSVHRIPHPTSVTIAIRPSWQGRDGPKYRLICVFGKTEIFLWAGLDKRAEACRRKSVGRNVIASDSEAIHFAVQGEDGLLRRCCSSQ